MSNLNGGSWARRRAPRREFLPSFNFLFIALLFTGTGAAMWHDVLGGRFVVFTFVLAGWVVSLCLHEFGHAVTAYLGGDKAIADTGYLSLDPMRYSDPIFSIVVPVVFILFGGIGLPGGAVFIHNGRLRNRLWVAAVSAAGPLANLLVLIGLGLLYGALVDANGSAELGAGIGVLAFFQATAIILNLLPIPGLDGFGVLRPFLPYDVVVKADQMGSMAILILFLLLWLTKLGAYLIQVGLSLTSLCGIDIASVIQGFGVMRLF